MASQEFLILIGAIGSACAATISLLVGILVHQSSKKIDECVEDTKDCNKSISVLATRQAVADTQLHQIMNRLDGFSSKMSTLTKEVLVLKTKDQMREDAGE